MFFPESQFRIWLCTQPTDMRRSFDGLSAQVKQQLMADPLSGHLFVFINRKRTHMKILFFDRSGYCIWAKRLEQGRFHLPQTSDIKHSLSWTELKLMLEGIDVKTTRQRKRWRSGQSLASVL